MRDDIRGWVSTPGHVGLPAEPGRYHLYVSYACPFAARAIIARRLKGLEDIVSMSPVDTIRDQRGWAFTHGEYADPVNGFGFLSDAYQATRPGFDEHVSVPVLWDRKTRRIVSNQSGDIMRMLGSAWDSTGGDPGIDLYPVAMRAEIDQLNDWIHDGLNSAVYKAGLATSRAASERAHRRVFSTLDALQERIATSRYLLGPHPTEPDWRLFATLVRFDLVYVTLFKLDRNHLTDMPGLWGYTRDLYQHPGIAETVRLDEITRHYHAEFSALSSTGVVPLDSAPAFAAPHDRDKRFGHDRSTAEPRVGESVPRMRWAGKARALDERPRRC